MFLKMLVHLLLLTIIYNSITDIELSVIFHTIFRYLNLLKSNLFFKVQIILFSHKNNRTRKDINLNILQKFKLW